MYKWYLPSDWASQWKTDRDRFPVTGVPPTREESDFRWDIEGWRGGDFNRVWFKSEGERNTAFKAEYDIDLQLLYGRFVKRFYDLQVGVRLETHSFRAANVTRAHAVVGLEGLVPNRYDFESALFISHQGDVSGRNSFTRDYLLTQRWILQGRFETNIAAQRVERFGVEQRRGGPAAAPRSSIASVTGRTRESAPP